MVKKKRTMLSLLVAIFAVGIAIASAMRLDAPGLARIGSYKGEALYYLPPTADTLRVSMPCDSFNQVFIGDRRVAFNSAGVWKSYTIRIDSALVCDGAIHQMRLRRQTNNLAYCYVTSYPYGESELLYSYPSGQKIAVVDGFTYGDASRLVIPDTVETRLGEHLPVVVVSDSAFVGAGSRCEIHIPPTVTWIGRNAFSDLDGVELIEVDSRLLTMCGAEGEPAFPSGAKTLILGQGMERIPDYAFSNLTEIESLTIPESVTTIGEGAFRDCTSLKRLELNAKRLAACGAFRNPAFPSGLTEVAFGDSVRFLPDYAFKDCSTLSTVALPDSLELLGEFALSGCRGLDRLQIGPRIRQIPYGALQSTQLRTLVVGAGVDTIKSQYADRSPLKIIWLGEKLPVGGIELGRDAKINYVAPGFEGAGTLPSAAEAAGLDGMWKEDGIWFLKVDDSIAMALDSDYDPEISELLIPETVERGERTYRVTSTGRYAFAGNTRIESVIFGKECKVGDYAFSGLTGLRELSLENVALAGKGLFSDCTSLERVAFGESITELGSGIFGGCRELRKVTLGEDMARIGEQVFSGCVSLTLVESLAGNPPAVADDSFAGFDQRHCTLEVEEDKVELYRAAEGWKEFRVAAVGIGEVRDNEEREVWMENGALRFAAGVESGTVYSADGRLIADGPTSRLEGLSFDRGATIIVRVTDKKRNVRAYEFLSM